MNCLYIALFAEDSYYTNINYGSKLKCPCKHQGPMRRVMTSHPDMNAGAGGIISGVQQSCVFRSVYKLQY